MPASLQRTFEHNCAIVQRAILRRARLRPARPRPLAKLGKYADFTFAGFQGI
jgi:hypothetical protein